MNKQALNSKTKILFFSMCSGLLLSCILHFSSVNNSGTSSSDVKFQTYLDDSYSSVLNEIKGKHPSEIDYKALDDSPFDALIEVKDSVVYWNNNLTSLQGRYNSSFEYAIFFKQRKNQTQITIGLDLRENGKFAQVLKTALPIKYSQDFDQSINASLEDNKGKTVAISGSLIEIASWLNQASYFIYLFATCMFFMWLYRVILVHRRLPIVLGFGVGIVILLLDKFFLYPLFENTFLANINSELCDSCPSLQAIFIFLVVIIFWMNLTKRMKLFQKAPPIIGQVLVPFSITLSFVSLCHFAKSLLYSHPLKSQYAEVLQYTSEGISYLISFVAILTVIFYGSVILFKSISSENSQTKKYLGWVLGIALTYPIAHSLDIQIPIWTLYTFVLSYLLILELYLENSQKNIIYTIWWIIIFSGFLASTTFYYRLQSETQVQAKNIEALYTFSTEESSQTAFLIDSTLQSSNVFAQLSDLPYPSGLDRYDFQAYVLSIITDIVPSITSTDFSLEATDQQGLTLFNNHYSTSYTFKQALSTANRLSQYVYFNPFDNAYYFKYQVENVKYNDAPFDLIIKIQQDKKQTIAPEKLSNFVILKNKNVVARNIKDNTDFSIRELNELQESKIQNDISYSVYQPTERVKIIAFNKIGGLIKPISLFSFIVSLAGILLFIVTLINTRFKFLPSELDIQFDNSSSLRTRIQLTIIMLIVFSFLIIGIMTAFYFKNVLTNYNYNNQKEEITSLQNDIRNSIEGVENNLLAGSTVQSKIEEMSHVHDKDLAFFDQQGKMVRSSFTTPEITRVPFEIVRAFSNPNSLVTDNSITLDDGKYTVDFIPLYYQSQLNPYGFLGLSYKPINDSKQSIRDFLSTILNVYIFLFLIAGALAIAIGNSITKPLEILSNKLKEFKLGKTNQVLDWDTKDEIGNLINEYNQLTEKLDESVSILSRTERDNAWREMAKQVAHEIKNPLTPMKLSIQYLEKAVKSNPEQAASMIERVSSTLIEQINNLNQIANEFSNFATMPQASNEKIVINEIVEAIHDLFRKREDMEIKMTEPIDDLFVFADRNHLVRILNNIVKNAIQAIPTDKKGKIKISLSKVGNQAIVAVKDNGSGIPDHMKEKVFTPNFTTKSSGTGLGLAISANMIESFNGRIYFETQVDVGTEFFVEIPLMRLQDNFPEQNRVSLD